MYKNTRRFYIVMQAFWQAENENQLVFTTAKMPQKSRKLSHNREAMRCSKIALT